MILFLILSLLYFHIQASLFYDVSAFNIEQLRSHFAGKWTLLGLFFLSIVSIWFAKKISKLLSLLFLLHLLYLMISFLIQDFDKVILLMIFLYIVTGFYFYFFWLDELKEPYYNPCYNVSDLNKVGSLSLPVTILDKDDLKHEGYLTNWDSKSCFIVFKDPIATKKKRLKAVFNLDGREFANDAEVVTITSDKRGLGVDFVLSGQKTDRFTWEQLYTILYQRSFIPEYIK